MKVREEFVHDIPDLKHYSLSMLTAVMMVGPCTTFAWAGNEFQEQFKEYQEEVNSGNSALYKKEYESAIKHYSKAIEMSPFEAMHYFNSGIARFLSFRTRPNPSKIRNAYHEYQLRQRCETIAFSSHWSVTATTFRAHQGGICYNKINRVVISVIEKPRIKV